MRAFLAIALLTAVTAVSADPKSHPAREGGTGSANATSDLERPRTVARADDAGIIVPAPMPDDRPYPRGMVIAPPDVGDRMNIAPPPAWSFRTFRKRFEHVLDSLWSALQTPRV